MNSSEQVVGTIPPPPGVTPNFDNPSASIANRMILAAAIAPAVSLPFLLLRLYTSSFIVRRWHKDDVFIILGFVSASKAPLCPIQYLWNIVHFLNTICLCVSVIRRCLFNHHWHS